MSAHGGADHTRGMLLRLLRGGAPDTIARESRVPAHELESRQRAFVEHGKRAMDGTRGSETAWDPEDRLYRTYRSARNLSSVPASPSSVRKTLKIFDSRYSKYLPPDRGARIVEIGCGDGTFISFLQSKGFDRVEGVDSSPEQVELARSLGRHQVTLGDNCDRLKALQGEVDMVVALDVLEHYAKPQLLSLLDAVYAALEDTGVFLIQTPNADGPFGSRHRYLDFTHELAFTPSSLSQVLRMVGFRHIECVPVEPVVHGFPSLIRWCAWKTIRLLLVGYLAIETGCLRGHVLTQNMIALARK